MKIIIKKLVLKLTFSYLLKTFVFTAIGSLLFYYFTVNYFRPYYLLYHTLYSKKWHQRHEQFKTELIKKKSIIFIGNSLTAYFDLKIFNNENIVNRGLQKDFTQGVLKRLPEIVSREPDKIFIEIGINDLLAGLATKTLLENYEKIISHLKSQCPNTDIYIQSLLPTCFEDGFFVNNTTINQKIIITNQKLIELCRIYSIQYIDIHQKFLLKNQLNPKYTYDGVHLTKEGYQLWTNQISSYINLD